MHGSREMLSSRGSWGSLSESSSSKRLGLARHRDFFLRAAIASRGLESRAGRMGCVGSLLGGRSRVHLHTYR